MKLVLAAALIACGLAASAQQPSSPAEDINAEIDIRMNRAQAAQCEAEGGCGIFSRAYLQRMVEEARKQACRDRKKEV